MISDEQRREAFVAAWALEWIPNHMRDMQEAACDMFCG